MSTKSNMTQPFMKSFVILALGISFFISPDGRAQDTDGDAVNPAEEEVPVNLDEEEVPVNLDEEEAVDLDDFEEDDADASAPPSHEGHGHGAAHGGGASSKFPRFKLFFDFLVEYEFETDKFQFTSEHSYVMLDLNATPWLSFRTDLSINPEFFEMIFNFGPSFELALGKVLVPFGQNEWHHLIGGRVDNQSLFLPTIWSDYGIRIKHRLIDGEHGTFSYALYAVNGFQASVDGQNNPFPSRNAGYLEDNNQMKGVGIRPTLYLDFLKMTIGSSWYFDAWDEDNEGKMLFYGVDVDLGYGFIPVPVLKNLRLRAEAAWGEIELQNYNPYSGIMEYGSRRAGYNLEVSYKIIPILTLRYREGYVNTDSRFRNWGDVRIHEPAVITRVGPVVFYLCAQFVDPLVKEEDMTTPQEEFSSIFLRVMLQY